MRHHLTKSLCLFLLMAVSGYADSLYFDFALASSDTWAAITAPLNAANWHVGGPGGPIATNAELSSVLSNLSGLQIGAAGATVPLGCCAFASEGFVLSNPDLAGLASDDFSTGANGWTSNFFGVGTSPFGGFPSGGTIFGDTNTSDLTFTQVLFIAPGRYLGDKNAALSHSLTFSFQATGMGLFDPTSGVVILTSPGADAAPEPAGLLLAGPSAFAILFFRKRRCRRLRTSRNYEHIVAGRAFHFWSLHCIRFRFNQVEHV